MNVTNLLDTYRSMQTSFWEMNISEKVDAVNFFRVNGFLCDAIEKARYLVTAFPEDKIMHTNLASCYVAGSQFKNANLHFERAAELSGFEMIYARNLAHNYYNIGRHNDADQILLKSVQSLTCDATSVRLLAGRSRNLDADNILRLISHLDAAHLDEKDEAQKNWALYRAYSLRKEYHKALKHLTICNDIKFKLGEFKPNRDRSNIKTMEKIFSEIDLKEQRLDENGDLVLNAMAPIFIVGMPRSGSTILEKVLQHYFGIPSLGELETGASAAQALRIGTPLKEALTEMREVFLHSVGCLLPNESRYFIDKSLFNFRYLGFLLLAFPQSKSIIVTRDKKDTLWSNYTQFFAGSDLSYSFSFDATSKMQQLVNDYQKLWLQKFPERIQVVDNADLVRNPLAICRQLKDFMGRDIKFVTESEFEGTKTPSVTASSDQIRSGLKPSTRSWCNYVEFLPSEMFKN